MTMYRSIAVPMVAVLIFLQIVSGHAFALAAGSESASPAPAADPEDTLYLDLDYGRVVIHMRPDLAPRHVQRIKHLVRERFYDGLMFHRVIAGFMAQTGDPGGTGSGGSGRSIDAEFSRALLLRGTVAMARTADKNSADSQWFIVLSDNHPPLDGKYTVWGEVTAGMEFVDMIHKGDAGNNGKVKNPDRVIRLQVVADQVAADADHATAGASVHGDTDTAGDFSAAEFRCSALGDDSGMPSQSAFAQIWTHGYLVGSYKARNQLTFADGTTDMGLADACKADPQSFLMTTVSEMAKMPRELPPAAAVFLPASYTCANYTAARKDAHAAEAENADLWGFGFIQGFKNVGQPNMEIPFDVRPRLLGAVASVCAKNPNMGFLDATALVAGKVKLQ